MSIDDRLGWLLLGCMIGFVLGYIVRSLREIKEELDEVDVIVKQARDDDAVIEKRRKNQDENGFVRYPYVLDVALILVVALTVWASFQTAKVNGELDRTLNCLTEYNAHQGKALTTRDAAIKSGTQSEIDLWTEYGRLYALATKDPSKIPDAQVALNEAIMAHRRDLEDLQTTRDIHPYAKPNILKDCKENND